MAQRWSAEVTQHSDALDLRGGVFTWDDPRRIALSLKRSAERSRRRKADPFRSAMSMLNLYLNRAGKNVPAQRRRILNAAKDELRGVRPAAQAEMTRSARREEPDPRVRPACRRGATPAA